MKSERKIHGIELKIPTMGGESIELPLEEAFQKISELRAKPQPYSRLRFFSSI